jgi:hypothetical protein
MKEKVLSIIQHIRASNGKEERIEFGDAAYEQLRQEVANATGVLPRTIDSFCSIPVDRVLGNPQRIAVIAVFIV